MTSPRNEVAALLFAFTCSACVGSPELGPTSDEVLATAVSALDLTQPISVRIISIAGANCAAMSDADANKSIDIINKAGGISGLKFRLYRHDVDPLSMDLRYDLPTWDTLKPLWQPMGISTAAGQTLITRMNNWSADQRYLHRWLAQYRQILMPNQVVAYQGCDGGIKMDTGSFFSSRGNFTHEMGHGFNLSHSFEMALNCSSWDLMYAARGRGVPNVYFNSHADCDNFLASGAPYVALYRIDGRNEDSHGGRQRKMSGGVITVQHPRCATCGVDLGFDQPADDGVERYQTGDAQIAGYAKYVDGTPAVNAMSYCSAGGCPDSSAVGTTFYSPSQIDIMKSWASDRSWVFSQGNPVAISPPSRSCGYLLPNEGINRDQPLYSCDGRFRLYLQADGNLVFSQKASDGQFSTVLWSTQPLVAGTDTTDIRLTMQAADGNLVVYSSAPTALWSTRTAGHPGAYLKLSDSGDIKVRTADGSSFYWKAP